MGYDQAFIDVDTEPRKEGKSSYNFRRKMGLAEDILTSQSDSLLRVSSYIGFIITFISFIYIIFLIIQYFVADIDPGWTSVIATLLLVGGLMISSIGIAGIYIGKIFMQTKNRPLYIVKSIRNNKDDQL